MIPKQSGISKKMFLKNHAKVFERLGKEIRSNNIKPGSQESVKFWSGIKTNQLDIITRSKG